MNWELNKILELSKGKVVLLADDERRTYASGDEAIKQLNKEYKAVSIAPEDDALVIKLEENQRVGYDSNSDFVKSYVAQYGREPNMFDGD
ncbi:hypothetical protein [Pseudobutyrivibrio xylanivorans]|uniref:Uncharacterized protein n=1 Tax=Pseudobutyrivibrio xylanivorans TaxID=185007 RepID=A0A5P6VVU2_PSEXY|nr:hypothetical protein [Pseudobutyrivibrio xylanivorans]QFJ55864.1 hypothetical protein FXF36_13705 [Pseudobutyrivibrio xylanivorans]